MPSDQFAWNGNHDGNMFAAHFGVSAMLSSLIFAAALAASASVQDSSSPTAAAQKTVAAEPSAMVQRVSVVADKDRDDPMVCQSIEVTGSMFTERQCLHQSQWAQRARDGQDLYGNFSSGGAIIPDGPTGRH